MESAGEGIKSLRSCLKASKIRNIDGRILSKDGKPMIATRQLAKRDYNDDQFWSQNMNVASCSPPKSFVRVFNGDNSGNEVTKVPVWVKMHKVPIVAYSKDELNLIATPIGTPIMLDAFTSSTYVDSWGRIRFARALIEVSADKELKHEVTMALPIVDATKEAGFETIGYTKEKIRVEYEWKPPICHDCHIFDHTTDQCPKRAHTIPKLAMDVADDGFTTVRDGKSNMNKKDASYGSDSESEVKELVLEGNHNVSDVKRASTPYDDVLNGWSVVGHDVCNVVWDFFSNGEINHTFLALISKGIKEVVSGNQAAFVLGRRISDNILITQELMHIYHRNHGPPRYDISIFARGELASARVILESLDEFKMVSSLVPSIPKSTAYFCNVVHYVKLAILYIMPFSKGELMVKYVGVPLISLRLLNKDCKFFLKKLRIE
nr:hypothetical protein [Tanacetum cinerariifolium]